MISFQKHFQVVGPIDNGRYGTVWHVVDRHNPQQAYAAKKLPYERSDIPNERNKSMIRREVRHWRTLSGLPNILPYVGIVKEGRDIYMMSEYCQCGTLQMLSALSLTEYTVSHIVHDIACGIYSCHSNDIVHCDIKHGNILYSSSLESWVLCDFGASQQCSTYYSGLSVKTCTPLYCAPEIFLKKEYGKEIDVWALGIITYMLLFKNRHPFTNATDLKQVKIDILTKEINWENSKGLSKDAKDFIRKCLTKENCTRVHIEELFNHPFISKWNRSSCTSDKMSDLSILCNCDIEPCDNP